MAAPTHLGTSDPISTAPPSELDLKLNDSLIEELKAQKNFASEEEKRTKEEIIAKLKVLLRRMVQMVGKRKGLPQSILEVAGGEVFPFGSHRLGVYAGNSDVDTLMVGPKHVSREDFFEIMPNMLKESVELGDVTEPNPVPGISVPIIKVEIRGVDIDLIFTNLQMSAIPDNLDLNDTNLLRGLDATDLRCVNGTRVTNRILQLVPQVKTFRYALRAVKLWAQRRAIYGNIVGFPGGVAYAMMVARICQLYPKAVGPLLVQKFFFIMKRWNWPTPVRLQHQEVVPLQLREWDPNTSRGDASHLMPVITPAYPVANSTHTITPSTKRVLLREFERGDGIVNEIYDGKKQWKDLFQRHTFFTDTYRHFICVITAAKTDAAQKGWTGFVQSKLKQLASGIEYSDSKSVDLVQPYNKGFDRVHDCNGHEQVESTLDGSLDYQVKETKTTEQTNDVKVQALAEGNAASAEAEAAATNGVALTESDGQQTIYTTTYYLGIALKKGASNLDLSSPIFDFKKVCTDWQQYDENIHSIRIKYMRNFDLPADVFVEGEVRPTRAKKAKTNNKRSLANAGLDETAESAKRRPSANGRSATSTPNGVSATMNGTAG